MRFRSSPWFVIFLVLISSGNGNSKTKAFTLIYQQQKHKNIIFTFFSISFFPYHPPNAWFVFDEVAYKFLERKSERVVQIFQNIFDVGNSFIDIFASASVDNRAGVHLTRISDVLLCFRKFFFWIKISFICDNPAEWILIFSPNCPTYECLWTIWFHEFLYDCSL